MSGFGNPRLGAWAFGFLGILATSASAKPAPPVFLSDDFAYFRSAGQSDFWPLISVYVPQNGANSDGLTSALMAVNALRTSGSGGVKAMSFEAFAKSSPKLRKQSLTSGKGAGALEDFVDLLAKVLARGDSEPIYARLERFDGKNSKAELKRLEKFLSHGEKSKDEFAIADFLVAAVTGDRGALSGHWAPIGAYDSRKRRVLLLDPDRANTRPFWAPVDKFFDGINTTDPASGKKRGLIVFSRTPPAETAE